MFTRRVCLLLLTLLGCSRSSRAALDCPSIEGLDAVVQPGTLVVFGEIHGTNESPAFVGDVACNAARRAPVHVGLELPTTDALLLETLLGGKDAGLGDSAFWRKAYQDGRSSRAMLTLVERLRGYRQKGAPIDVFFFDDADRLGVQRRDEAMAANISLERKRAPSDIYLIEVGNYHARHLVGAPWDASKRWMASFLAESEPRLVTLDVRFPAGSAWVCLPSTPGSPDKCGVVPLKGSSNPPARTEPRAIRLEPQPEVGYDGTYTVGTMTASFPAFVPEGAH